jgi:hypothetical protein
MHSSWTGACVSMQSWQRTEPSLASESAIGRQQEAQAKVIKAIVVPLFVSGVLEFIR